MTPPSPSNFFGAIQATVPISSKRSDEPSIRNLLLPLRQTHGTGGWFIWADPDISADKQAVYWDPEILASTVILTRAVGGESEVGIRFMPEHWHGQKHLHRDPNGEHIILTAGRVEHRLWLPGPPPHGASLAVVLPCDPFLPMRAAASVRLWHHLKNGASCARQPADDARRDRLISSLRAVDARNSGASYRMIAEMLYGRRRVEAEGWKTASVRDVTIRLVRHGLTLVRGGYRKLLQRSKRS